MTNSADIVFFSWMTFYPLVTLTFDRMSRNLDKNTFGLKGYLSFKYEDNLESGLRGVHEHTHTHTQTEGLSVLMIQMGLVVILLML